MLESLTDFILAIGTIWLLCIATIVLGEIRRDTPLDDDIHDDWHDIRTAIRILNTTITQKIRRTK